MAGVLLLRPRAQLRLLLMLGINCMAASTLIGIALSHADPAESPEAIKDA